MYFIIDPTRTDKKTRQDYIAKTNNVKEFVLYLEGLVQRKFNKTRPEFVQDQSDFAGFTENNDQVFYDMISAHGIVTGQVRKSGLVPCDVIRESYYSSKKEEHGN